MAENLCPECEIEATEPVIQALGNEIRRMRQEDFEHREAFGSFIITEDTAMERAYMEAYVTKLYAALNQAAKQGNKNAARMLSELQAETTHRIAEAADLELYLKDHDMYRAPVLLDPPYELPSHSGHRGIKRHGLILGVVVRPKDNAAIYKVQLYKHMVVDIVSPSLTPPEDTKEGVIRYQRERT